jgi:hypothetical protein
MCCLRCWINCRRCSSRRTRYAIALTFRRSIQRSQSNLSIKYFGRFPVPGRMMCGISRSRIMSYIMPTESPTYTTDCFGVRSLLSGETGMVLKRCWRLMREAPDGALFIPSSPDCLGVRSRFSAEIGTVLKRCWRLIQEAPDGVLFIPPTTTDCLGVRGRFSGEIGPVLKRCWRLIPVAPIGAPI